eukprot:11317034-Heterocapsa_arctica.AAC.1
MTACAGWDGRGGLQALVGRWGFQRAARETFDYLHHTASVRSSDVLRIAAMWAFARLTSRP